MEGEIFMFKESILKKEELNDSMDIINNSNSGNVESEVPPQQNSETENMQAALRTKTTTAR